MKYVDFDSFQAYSLALVLDTKCYIYRYLCVCKVQLFISCMIYNILLVYYSETTHNEISDVPSKFTIHVVNNATLLKAPAIHFICARAWCKQTGKLL